MQTFENLTEEQIDSELIFDGRLLHVYKDSVKLPNGHESTREYISHLGAVAIVAITDDGKMIIEKQFRYPLHKAIIEIPAGKIDSITEDRLDAAKRELLEETGITADEWITLGEYHPAAAYSSELITIYIAKGLHEGDQKLDEDEFLNIEKMTVAELVDLVMNGEITDGKTQVAIMKAALYLGYLKK